MISEPDDTCHRSIARARTGSLGPVGAWTPAIAPSGMTTWRGTLLVSALRGRSIEQVTVDRARVVSRWRLLQFDQRLRDVRATVDGKALWVLTDGSSAELLRVTPNQPCRGKAGWCPFRSSVSYGGVPVARPPVAA